MFPTRSLPHPDIFNSTNCYPGPLPEMSRTSASSIKYTIPDPEVERIIQVSKKTVFFVTKAY